MNPILILLAVSGLLVSSLAQANWIEREAEKLGTRVQVQFWLEDAAVSEVLADQAMSEFDRIERIMSTYIDGSEISLLNSLAADSPQQVSAELYALIDVALQVSELTGGAFDVSYEGVGRYYDYRAAEKPDVLDLEAGLQKVGYRNIKLDPEALTVGFSGPGVQINLGGIAKGYAIEQVSKLLRDAGVKHALVSAGGDIRVTGDDRGSRWRVGVPDPNDSERMFTNLELEEEAVSTSTDYERYFIVEGRRYHHILDPADGRPVEGVRSVTVVGPDATLTDALSTAVFVLGAEAGMALIGEMEGFEALIILADDTWFYSGGLRPYSPEETGQSSSN